MYKLFFFFDTRIPEQKDAALEILGYNDRFRAESIRHTILVSYIHHPTATLSDVLSMSNISIDKAFTNAESDSKANYQRVCFRWPKNQVTKSLLDEVCHKAEVLNFTSRASYLLGLYMIGRDLLKGRGSLPQSLVEKVSQTPKHVVGTKFADKDVVDVSLAVSSADTKTDAKTALSGLMKRKKL